MDPREEDQEVVASNTAEADGVVAKLSSLNGGPIKLQLEEDGDYCRICRGEGTAEQPLFYPCKCSGSIRFVHQDCLMEWLSHSQKKYCELCKTPFTFTKLYDRSMPEELPLALFLRQIVIHGIRGISKWTRFFIVGFVWLGWLPWSIRQVWRGLFWLADGSWVSPTGIGRAAVATANLTASLPLANDSLPLTSSFAHANLSNSAIRTQLANSIPELFAPISAFLTFSTDDFLVVKLIRLLFPNFLRWATRFFSGTSSPDDTTTANRATRLPSLLSDIPYFENLTTYSVVNNAVVDVLEGQLICLLIVTTFILIFLIREWVINQQPAANIPDPDRVEEAAIPLQVNRNPRQVARRRRRGLREALDQREHGQNPGRPLVIDDPRVVNVPADARRDDIEALVDNPIQEDEQEAEVTSPADHASDSVPFETTRPNFGSSSSPTTPLLTPEARPALQIRNALDQAADIRRKIEEGTADLESHDLSPQSDDIGHESAWEDLYEPRLNFHGIARSGDADLIDPEKESLVSSHDEVEPGMVAENQALVRARSNLAQGSISPTDAAYLPRGHSVSVNDDPQSSDDSGSQIVEIVATPATSMGEHDAPLSDTDGERLPQTPENTSGGDEPSISDGDNIVNARSTFWDRVADWLWHTDPNTLLPADVIEEDDDHIAQDIEVELPFLPALGPQEDDARHNDALPAGRDAEAAGVQGGNPLGIDLNNPDAIEEAEDLDGILELIGMQGPIAGMIQNVILSEFLITLTIAASVWLPYIWGKIALLVLANPIGMFVKAPLHLASRIADTIVDIMLFIAAFAIFAAHSCISFLIPWLTYVRPGWATAVDKSFFMSKSLTVANISLTLAKGSGARLERALSGTFLGLRPDLPTFSIMSHQALRTFEQNFVKCLDTISAVLASAFHHSPSQLQGLVDGPLKNSNGNATFPWAFATTIREQALNVSGYVMWSFKTMTIDLGSATSSPPKPLDYALIRWSTRDKVLAIILGYTFLSVVGYLYLKISRLVFGLKSGEKVEGMVADALNQAGGVMKVILIIGIEMIAFPLYCGMLLDVALMPLFAGVTFESRLTFIMQAPLTALFVHWFIGTCYMFHFALFVSMCRKMMRKGVLYFIRDPDDPTFHPVRDVLERPLFGQLSKIAFSALVYGGLVMLCLGGVIWALTCINGILPINWVTNEPKFDLPLDVIFYNFFLPILIRKIEPSKKIAAMWEWWFRGCASGLRLTHFLFDEVKEDERGTRKRWSWNPFFRDGESKLDFQLDGTFVRAPASDSVRIPKGERVFLEVNKDNERVDGLEDKDDGPHGKANKNFAQVYVPPNFRARIATFIILIWLFAATIGVLFTIVPLLLGRSIIAYVTQIDQSPNDLYAFTIGLHLCGAIAYAAAYYRLCKDWIVAKASALFADTRQILPKIKSGVLHLLGLMYISTTFGIVLPFIFSVISELYFLMPLYTYLTSDSRSDTPEDVDVSASRLPTTIHILQTWTLGLLYLRLALRFATGYANGQTRAATAVRAILRNGILHPDVRLATRAFVVPALTVSALLLAAPQGLGWMANAIVGVQEPELRMKLYRYAYPGLMAGVLATYCAVLLKRQIGVWRVRIRDEVYLIGERLHNFGEGGKSASAVARQRGVGVGMERMDVDIH
jgi:E3 ubiquitin-protein ligase MARCH6